MQVHHSNLLLKTFLVLLYQGSKSLRDIVVKVTSTAYSDESSIGNYKHQCIVLTYSIIVLVNNLFT